MRAIAGPVNVSFETSGIRGVYAHCHVQEVTFQRNGTSGEGFHVVRFVHIPTEQGDHRGPAGARILTGVVFDAPKMVAVIDPANLADHWRGDQFEDGLREAVAAWEAKA